jgi:hypothetical protein
LNEGCLFWVYIGHGNKQRLDRVQIPAASYPILEYTDTQYLQTARGLPIALMLACYTGAFDQPSDCIAEAMLRQPRGPVAVICGSRVTMPYAMAVMSNTLMDQVFRQEPGTLGQRFCQAKQETARQDRNDPNRQLLDAVAAAISPSADLLPAERLEHLALFNLLGDPLLRMPNSEPVQLETPSSTVAGEPVPLRIKSELAGRGMIEIVTRRDRLKTDLPGRPYFDPSDAFLRSFDPSYLQANDRVWIRRSFLSNGQPVELQLAVPLAARGHCYVRVWIEGQQASAQGATRLFVTRPRRIDVAAE